MKLTCLSKGSSFHSPPSHLLAICGFHVLLDCPVDFSALSIFSPIPSPCSNSNPDASSLDSGENSLNSEVYGRRKRRKIENSLEGADLISAAPWYRTAKYLHFWDVSTIDVVLISSPMGMLGLPFLTRDCRFSAKIYATEVAVRLGQLMMKDLVSMQDELSQFYGPEECACPEWMKTKELESLPWMLRKIAMGDGIVDLGNWHPLYSAADINNCVKKIQTLKYGEEVCYNGTLIIKAFSSGLEIGSCNWMINGPRRNVTYLSSSIPQSAPAMDFNFQPLQGNDILIFSDFSSLHGNTLRMSLAISETEASHLSVNRENFDEMDELMKSLITGEGSEEMEKIAFICSCAVNSVKGGGSVLIPMGRLGIVLQLLEQLSQSLESVTLKVPIFMISAMAEETLAYTNVIPEWLCKQHQEKLYFGEALFGHEELMKGKKLHVFPAIYSSNLLCLKGSSLEHWIVIVELKGPSGESAAPMLIHIGHYAGMILKRMTWQEPCIVFSPHWSLRLGPVVHLLRRWSGNQNSLLILEEGVDADVALLPYVPMAMKVLQCSFLSGIKMQKIQPLLEILQPKVVLFPEDMRNQHNTPSANLKQFLYYSENETVCVPSLSEDYETDLATELAFKLQPRTTTRWENIAVARLRGELVVGHGKHSLVMAKEPSCVPDHRLLHWGSVDTNSLLLALQEKGMHGSKDGFLPDGACLLRLHEPNKARIEIGRTQTTIISGDEALRARIFDVVSSILDGI